MILGPLNSNQGFEGHQRYKKNTGKRSNHAKPFIGSFVQSVVGHCACFFFISFLQAKIRMIPPSCPRDPCDRRAPVSSVKPCRTCIFVQLYFMEMFYNSYFILVEFFFEISTCINHVSWVHCSTGTLPSFTRGKWVAPKFVSLLSSHGCHGWLV